MRTSLALTRVPSISFSSTWSMCSHCSMRMSMIRHLAEAFSPGWLYSGFPFKKTLFRLGTLKMWFSWFQSEILQSARFSCVSFSSHGPTPLVSEIGLFDASSDVRCSAHTAAGSLPSPAVEDATRHARDETRLPEMSRVCSRLQQPRLASAEIELPLTLSAVSSVRARSDTGSSAQPHSTTSSRVRSSSLWLASRVFCRLKLRQRETESPVMLPETRDSTLRGSAASISTSRQFGNTDCSAMPSWKHDPFVSTSVSMACPERTCSTCSPVRCSSFTVGNSSRLISESSASVADGSHLKRISSSFAKKAVISSRHAASSAEKKNGESSPAFLCRTSSLCFAFTCRAVFVRRARVCFLLNTSPPPVLMNLWIPKSTSSASRGGAAMSAAGAAAAAAPSFPLLRRARSEAEDEGRRLSSAAVDTAGAAPAAAAAAVDDDDAVDCSLGDAVASDDAASSSFFFCSLSFSPPKIPFPLESRSPASFFVSSTFSGLNIAEAALWSGLLSLFAALSEHAQSHPLFVFLFSFLSRSRGAACLCLNEVQIL
eukprot:Rhum_TRINITY_DN14605_c4_g2::Rhum_TRINITY_DN14605_c4_g2_i1::g.103728::m.103728